MRLIDADALIEVISGNSYMLRDSINSMNFGMFWDGIEQAIDESPTIDAVPATIEGTLGYLHKVGWIQEHDRIMTEDVAPVRHGRWEKNDYLFLDTLYRCSVCGEEFYIENGTPQENQYCYCPNCGAKMDKQIGNAIEAHTEIIRCNECDYWERYCNRETGRCDAHMMTTEEDDFCSWSEKKDK